MKSALQLRPSQHLALTPQLQQAIRLLQLSTVELQQEVQSVLDENMMLEVVESNAIPTPSVAAPEALSQVPGEAQESIPNQSALAEAADLPIESRYPTQTGVDYDPLTQHSSAPSLQAHLLWQMALTPFAPVDQLIADVLIDSIDNKGYLQIDTAEVVSVLSDQQISEDDVIAVLHRIQQFDPPGVAARDVQECLLLQARQIIAEGELKSQVMALLTDHFALLAARDETQLARALNLSVAALQPVLQQIRSLHPHPGEQVGEVAAACVVPDVLVSQQSAGWRVELNPDMLPKLQINADYVALIRRADQQAENVLLKEHLQTARSFIRNLQTRHDTVLQVAQCIVQEQQAFFTQGVTAMKPLVLQEVADQLGLHESTVSRVTSHKFMQTPRGTFAFKYFFSSKVKTADGGSVSSTAVCAQIRQLVQAEPSHKPLSDNALTEALKAQGIAIARRTVAKYRESLRIPPSGERRRR
ncbi:MAG: RNA polymerase factor sigma-54 [Pseudomonadota bacterium]